MCEICHKSPCDRRCPNADEVVACVCDECGCDIIKGEDCFYCDGSFYCEDCFEEVAPKLLIDYCLAEKVIAESDVW